MKTILLIFSCVCLSGCSIKLSNTAISPDVKNFSVAQFETTAAIAPPTSGQEFSERFKQKILNNTRLEFQDSKGDMQFAGALTGYTVSFVAPQPNETNAFQRLTVRLEVSYRNLKETDPKKAEWTQSFERFANFPGTSDLNSVQNQLLEEIYEQLIEDVFNKAFTGW